MDQAIARFEQFLKRRFGHSSTSIHYISDLTIFCRTSNSTNPEAVTSQDIDHFVDQQIAAGMSPTTINRRLASLHAFFEYLASENPEREWPNPVNHRWHRLKVGPHLPRDVPDSEVARLFAVISDERDQAISKTTYNFFFALDLPVMVDLTDYQ